MHHWKFGIVILCTAFLPACNAADAPDEPPATDSDLTTSNDLLQAPVIDVSFSYKCKIFGKREDNSYPMNGKEVGHVDFSVETTGTISHAGARISQQNSDAVVVHWWCDAFSGINYTLKVWAKE